LAPILDTIASLTKQIHAYGKKVETLCRQRYPETKLLRPVSGVGTLTALGYILTLENPIASAGAGRWAQPWASSLDGINPEIAIPNCESLKLETLTCADCLSPLLNISWAPSVPTLIFAAGA
jgi:hypothetical protein